MFQMLFAVKVELHELKYFEPVVYAPFIFFQQSNKLSLFECRAISSLSCVH